jgi:hypothetical protein
MCSPAPVSSSTRVVKGCTSARHAATWGPRLTLGGLFEMYHLLPEQRLDILHQGL